MYPSGRHAYVCAYRIHGRKRLATLGRVDVLTLDQARERAIGYLGKVPADEAPQAARDEKANQKTVGELCEAFITRYVKIKRIRCKEAESVLRRCIMPALASRHANTITSADVEPIHSGLGARHPSLLCPSRVAPDQRSLGVCAGPSKSPSCDVKDGAPAHWARPELEEQVIARLKLSSRGHTEPIDLGLRRG